ncbi:MAG TPA: VOC family protein [Actinoplanes sp.]|nr:VOC family protein [Actinoplanes sp.]
MGLRPVMVNFKAVDPVALGRFWAEALGWTAHHRATTYVAPGSDFVWPAPDGLGINVVPVAEGKGAGKNGVHLDLAHRDGLIDRVRDLGATLIDVGQDDVPWTVLADPEGNEFCVLEPREIYRDTGPLAAVVADCADPVVSARFWGAAIDWASWRVTADIASFRADGGPFLEFLRAPGRGGRVHLDLLPGPGDDKAAEVERLRALGATDLDVGQGAVPWTCLSDPDGLSFCVLATE